MQARYTFNVVLTIEGKQYYGRSNGFNEADAIANAFWFCPSATEVRIVP